MRFQALESAWSPQRLLNQLAGEEGKTRQKARAWSSIWQTRPKPTAISSGSRPRFRRFCHHGGHGLRRFLQDLSADGDGEVAIPTTLNSAGCDREKMEEMDIEWPDFLKQQFEIVHAYERLGIDATLSCTPYDRALKARAASLHGPNPTPSVSPTPGLHSSPTVNPGSPPLRPR